MLLPLYRAGKGQFLEETIRKGQEELMHEVIFYPIAKGDTHLIRLENGKRIAFDFADLHNPNDKNDKRMSLAKNFKDDIGWPKREEIDVLAGFYGSDQNKPL